MSQQHVVRSLWCHKLQGIWGLRRVHQDQSLCELRCSSERAGPGFILFQGNVTIFAQHIGEQSPSVTHCGFVVETFGDRYCQKVCLCFSFGHWWCFLHYWYDQEVSNFEGRKKSRSRRSYLEKSRSVMILF